ncbi:hypothetical protein BBJ28_00026554 [Nothophytophthora sp. Chile5]|nr:hypothetical protein BBJ28_00026554 [Nothophytophthora sp. Chile5]
MEVPQTYRAYQFDNYGTTEKDLKLRLDAACPPLGPKQVRIKVASAALNPVDYILITPQSLVSTGRAPSTENPLGFGCDGAGTVVEVGSGVERLKVGDEVYAMTQLTACGTLADFVAIDEYVVALKPSNLTFDQAAPVPLVALTSYQALVEHAKLQKGERLLVLGGSSAVGIFAIQIAHAMGAHVIATASAKNAEFVKSLGADQVVDYNTEKWVDVLEKHSVDVIYDCGMEAAAWNHDAQLTLKKETGRFVTLLPIAEPVQPAMFGAKNVGEILVHPSAKDLDAITKYIENGEITPVIDSIYPFEKVQEALAKLKGRHARGKLVVQVAAEGQQ